MMLSHPSLFSSDILSEVRGSIYEKQKMRHLANPSAEDEDGIMRSLPSVFKATLKQF